MKSTKRQTSTHCSALLARGTPAHFSPLTHLRPPAWKRLLINEIETTTDLWYKQHFCLNLCRDGRNSASDSTGSTSDIHMTNEIIKNSNTNVNKCIISPYTDMQFESPERSCWSWRVEADWPLQNTTQKKVFNGVFTLNKHAPAMGAESLWHLKIKSGTVTGSRWSELKCKTHTCCEIFRLQVVWFIHWASITDKYSQTLLCHRFWHQ